MLTYADVCYTGDDSVGTETGDLFCDVADEMLAEVLDLLALLVQKSEKTDAEGEFLRTKVMKSRISMLVLEFVQ